MSGYQEEIPELKAFDCDLCGKHIESDFKKTIAHTYTCKDDQLTKLREENERLKIKLDLAVAELTARREGEE